MKLIPTLYMCFHVTEMEACWKASNQAVRGAATLTYIFNIKEWISPCLDEIHGHTAPHVFLFRRNSQGKGVMYYKNWSHNSWQPEEGLKLLKVSF